MACLCFGKKEINKYLKSFASRLLITVFCYYLLYIVSRGERKCNVVVSAFNGSELAQCLTQKFGGTTSKKRGDGLLTVYLT